MRPAEHSPLNAAHDSDWMICNAWRSIESLTGDSEEQGRFFDTPPQHPNVEESKAQADAAAMQEDSNGTLSCAVSVENQLLHFPSIKLNLWRCCRAAHKCHGTPAAAIKAVQPPKK
jgi:hypothetical protein